ncbi:IS256 family transposase [Lutibacter sp.]
MLLTKKQIENQLSKFLAKENGLNLVLEMMLNSMMLTEREMFLESKTRENKANGYRLGKVFGYGTQIELRIPRDRQSEFTPLILALFREQESYLKEVSFQLYSKGLTARDVSDVMETIYGKHFSKSKVSDITVSFYEKMEQWRERAIDNHYLALYIDGLQVNLKRDDKYQNECFYIILGLKEDYTREIIAIVNLPTESATGWREVFKELKIRGLKSVGIIVSDGLTGLDSSITEEFGSVAHQKCIVHLQRTLQAYVRKTDRAEIAEDLRYLFSPDDKDYKKENVPIRIEEIALKWEKKYKALAKYLKTFNWQPYFTYLDYNVKVRRMLYTTNWIERFNRSARRTLKIRGAFPSDDSVLALITSVAIEKSEKKYKYPIYNFKFEPKLKNK